MDHCAQRRSENQPPWRPVSARNVSVGPDQHLGSARIGREQMSSYLAQQRGMCVKGRRGVRSPTISARIAGPVCIGNWTEGPARLGSPEVRFLIRVYPPHHAQYGRDPNRVGSRSQTRSISHRIHRLLPRVDAAFAAITLSHVDRVPAALKSEIAQAWVIVRAATKWPLVSTLTLLDRKVVDAGNA